MRVPRKAVVRAGEGEAELAGGTKWVGGEIIGGGPTKQRGKDQAGTGGEGLG